MIKIELIGDWKQAWKYYSVWIYVFIGALPDIFDLAVKMDLLGGEGTPDALNYCIKLFSFAGVVMRLVKQGVASAQEAASRQIQGTNENSPLAGTGEGVQLNSPTEDRA